MLTHMHSLYAAKHSTKHTTVWFAVLCAFNTADCSAQFTTVKQTQHSPINAAQQSAECTAIQCTNLQAFDSTKFTTKHATF